MTKLKNTKKGMAKKALSISLVAAMLATSNVPVWAAEDLFSDGSAAVEAPAAETFSDNTGAVVEEAPAVQDAATLSADDMTDKTDFSHVDISSDDDGNLTVSGYIIKKGDNQRLQEFNYEIWNNGQKKESGSVTNGNEGINITCSDLESGTATVRFYRGDGQYNFNYYMDDKDIANFNPGKGTDLKWISNGKEYTEGGIAYDAGTVTATVTLPRNLKAYETAKIDLSEANDGKLTGTISSTSLNGSGNTLYATYKLSKEDINKTIKATVTVQIDGKKYISQESIVVTDAYTTLQGTPVIKVEEGDEVRVGATIYADTTDVTSTTDPEISEFGYMWQWYNTDTKQWENLDYQHMDKELDLSGMGWLYNKKIRVAVFAGEYFDATKSRFSDEVPVGADVIDDEFSAVVTDDNDKERDFNPLDTEANKLTKITVTYGDTELTAGKDYTLQYKGIDQVGPVDVTVTLLPTEDTDFTSGSKVFEGLYTLKAPTANPDFTIEASSTESEYNGKAVTPSVKVKNKNTNQVIDSSEYKVYTVGPDAGTYDVNVYVNGQGMAADETETGRVHTIKPKNIANHTSDFNLVIPDAVWDASEEAVKTNTVKNAKIQLFDNAVSSTEDLLETYAGIIDINNNKLVTIETLNWDEGGVKKAIRITFNSKVGGNYTGSITVDGKVNSRSIAQFQSQFTTAIKEKATGYVYNGKLQDALGKLLDGNYGYVELKDANGNKVKLYEGRDFEYKIIKGGTDAGDVSFYIEGKGNYDGNMTLSNVYSIAKANFTSDVKDNLKIGEYDERYINISYDPSLGDAGAVISAYTDLAKSKYSAQMVDGGYKLTLGKDFWLDKKDSNDKWIWFQPTVAENKVEGHGENTNFITTDDSASRNWYGAHLVNKDFNDSDIKVTVESAEYNGGKLVTPKVKVAYVKDGKEYVIDSEYYEVKVIQSAYAQGETGKVNIIAKDEGQIDTQKYPQLYTGNKMVDYTVSKTNLALGKIVATNGLTTLPSVAYDAAQAATETGITLDASKYLVKDASGNTVDPKYYTVSFTDNKAVGKATITVTGKAPYEGSISSTFTITKNNLPSGTLTLMSDKLSKVYTGESIELVKGTDYNITGELAGLTEGTDYMVAYDNNLEVTSDKEKAAVKLVGINNYAGEVVAYFDITPATITASNIKLGDAVYQGGVAVRPAVTITIPGGNATLTEGTDYTVSYLKAATNAGDEGLVQVTYADNKNINTKDSAKEATYTVTAKDLKDVTILGIADQEATGEQLTPEVTVMNGTVKLVEGKDYKVTYGENKEIGLGTVTIQPADGCKNYTGSQEATFNIIKATPEVGQAMISKVEVSGNTVTPVLSAEVDGAVGYDFVLSRSDDPTDTAARVDVSKNVLKTNTNFYYVEAGTYYIYCHAYNRDEDKIKQFGEWSNSVKVVVTATTPETPVITNLQKSSNGKHLKVTWTKCADATGYDIVMGNAVSKVNGEYRPVDYGKAVKKITNGNTVTVIFSNIPKGTYYVGLHAYNRTSETGVKVFSKWSTPKKVTINK